MSEWMFELVETIRIMIYVKLLIALSAGLLFGMGIESEFNRKRRKVIR